MAGGNECALLCFFLVGCSVFPTSSTVVRPFTALVLFLESLLLGPGRASGGSLEGQLEAQDYPERISVESVLND